MQVFVNKTNSNIYVGEKNSIYPFRKIILTVWFFQIVFHFDLDQHEAQVNYLEKPNSYYYFSERLNGNFALHHLGHCSFC